MPANQPAQSARSRPLASWWLRLTRRHFCFRCDRFTVTRHSWCQAASEMELVEEARRG